MLSLLTVMQSVINDNSFVFLAPKAAPGNVSSFSLGPNNLTVTWAHLKHTWGKITHYRVFMNTRWNVTTVVTTQNNYVTFSGLNTSTVYTFEVLGATSKGEGPISARARGKTLLGGKTC